MICQRSLVCGGACTESFGDVRALSNDRGDEGVELFANDDAGEVEMNSDVCVGTSVYASQSRSMTMLGAANHA